MNHFSTKTNKASSVINAMRIVLSKYRGDTTEQQARLEVLDELINYTVKIEVELNDTQELLGRYLMKIGELKSKLNDVEGQIILANLNNEKTVDEDAKEYLDKIKL